MRSGARTGSLAPLRWLVDALFRDVRLKLGALALSLLVFVVTRDEVTRVFTIPLRVVDDPDRVLTHPAPTQIKAELRGPWARVNRLQDDDLGVATLDLRGTRPGPMAIDPATLVMPTGVVLERLVYDRVDLRFEPVIERSVPIVPTIIGTVDPDHERGDVVAEPVRWAIRGGQSLVSSVHVLATEAVHVEGESDDVVRRVALLTPGPGVRLVHTPDEPRPVVGVRVEVRDIVDTRTVVAPVEPEGEAMDVGVLPTGPEVVVSGPREHLRVLFGPVGAGPPGDLPPALRGLARPGVPAPGTPPGAPREVAITFAWSEWVKPEVRSAVSLEPTTLRVPYQPMPESAGP